MATARKTQSGGQRDETRSTAAHGAGGTSTVQSRSTAAQPAGATATAQSLTPTEVAARAYEIWQASGRPNGHDQEHWFQAERELRGGQPSRGARR